MSFQCYSAEQLHTDLIFKGKFSGISRHLYMRGINNVSCRVQHTQGRHLTSALGKNDPGVLSKFDPAQEAAV